MQLTNMMKKMIILTAPLWFAHFAHAATEPSIEKAVQTKVVESVQSNAEQATPVVVNQININTATAPEIQKALVGIGAKKAEAIIQYRESHGAFTSVEQLLNVQGIGKSTLEKNRARIQL